MPAGALAAAERRRGGQGAAAVRLGLSALWLATPAPGWQKGLLIRRKLAQPEAFTFYLTLAPEATGSADLVRVAGTRWTIEACFEAAKGEVGLDQYEVRSWTGWHRHITLAMLAMPISPRSGAGRTRPRPQKSRSGSLEAPDLIRWSVQELRRIAIRLAQRRIQPAYVIAWSAWRRAHQPPHNAHI